MKKNHITKKELFKEYIENKKSMSQIGREYKIHKQNIKRFLLKYNIPVRPKIQTKETLTQFLVGQKFSYLEILSIDKKTSKAGWLVTCKCHSCGNVRDKMCLTYIKRGGTTSCGCRKDHYEKIRLNNRNKSIKNPSNIKSKGWNCIIRHAKRRGIIFSLNREEVMNLYLKQNGKCALTGLDIAFSPYSDLNTASIDRIDSNGGYTIDNVQIVHKKLNRMKSNFTMSDFVKYCRLVSKNFEGLFND